MTPSPIERQALVFNIQKYNMYDGPGIRTLVFFQGCPLRCQWCSNPEGQGRGFQVMFKAAACIHCGACVPVCPRNIHTLDSLGGIHTIDRSRECVGCRACEAACPASALSISGEMKSLSELMEIILEDKPFYDMSGGGVTLGGGEVMAQPEAAAALLQACQYHGVNTAVETCGYANPKALLKVAEFTDLFLFDIKHMDPERHLALTGVRNETILTNLTSLLQRGASVRIRMPLLKGVNDSRDEIQALLDFLAPYKDFPHFQGIDLLPYHKMGVHKYEQLGMTYPVAGDPALGDEDLGRIESWIGESRIQVAVVRH